MRKALVSGIALAAVTAGAVWAQPTVQSVTPSAVPPYRPITLRVEGSGFGVGCRALLGRQGRFVPVATRVLSERELEVHLAAGLPPTPPVRELAVACGGARSEPVSIRVTARPESPEAVVSSPVAQGPSAPTRAGVPAGPAAPAPVLTALDPEEVEAGEPFTLTVTGTGFREGAAVEVLANVHAGSTAEPEYRPRVFPAERLSDSVLLVDFDRGFAPEPALRPVRVVNPGGDRSAPLFLRIARRSP